MKNGINRLIFVFLLLVMSSSMVLAQSCPSGKTAFVWVNGILVKSAEVWQNNVEEIRKNFFSTHPTLNPACVAFDAVYNKSQGKFKTFLLQGDTGQAIEQMSLIDVEKYLIDTSLLYANTRANQIFMAGVLQFQEDQFKDHDLELLDQAIVDWWNKGYSVVLVGHSQGNFYINLAYGLRVAKNGGQLLNPNKLSMVGIATPTSYMFDGRNKYTTQCNDFIQYAPTMVGQKKALPWNVSNGDVSCAVKSTADFFLQFFFAVGDLVKTVYGGWLHHGLDKYLVPGSNTQKQIYRHLEDSLIKPLTLTPATNKVSIAQGSSGFVDLTLRSENGVFGNATVVGYCTGDVDACPLGFSIKFSRTIQVSANDALQYRITFNTSNKPKIGTHQYEFQITLNGVMVKAEIDVIVTAPVATTGTINASMLGYFSPVSCKLNGVGFTLTPGQITKWENQAPGEKILSCSTVSGYKMAVSPSEKQTLSAGKTVTFTAIFTPIAMTPLTASCSANPTTIIAGQSITFTGIPSGGIGNKTVAWSGIVSGNSNIAIYNTPASMAGMSVVATFTVKDSAVPPKTFTTSCGATVNPVTQKGTVKVTVSGYNGSVSCVLNGISISAPTTLTNQSTGSKSLSCHAPTNYVVTVSPTSQNLSVGRIVNFSVMATPKSTKPVLNHLSVNTQPKVNTNINISLFGSGFTSGSQGYVCTSASTSSCVASSTVYVNNTQVSMNRVRSSTARTLYLRVRSSSGAWSNYLKMIVIK